MQANDEPACLPSDSTRKTRGQKRKTTGEPSEETFLNDLKPTLSPQTLSKIEEKIRRRAQKLAAQKKQEIESLMNEVLLEQMKKLDALTEFAQDFHELYDLQEGEIDCLKEQCLAERVATTAIKQGSQDPKLNSVLFTRQEL